MEETTLSGQHGTTFHAGPAKLRSPFGWKAALLLGLVAVCAAVFVFVFLPRASTPPPTISTEQAARRASRIDPQELQALLDNKSATVCDVRREADYQADQRTIAGAEWHNPETVDVWAEQLPRNKPVAIYCARGGSVSKSTHEALTGKGFEVQYLEGGLAAWDEFFK